MTNDTTPAEPEKPLAPAPGTGERGIGDRNVEGPGLGDRGIGDRNVEEPGLGDRGIGDRN